VIAEHEADLASIRDQARRYLDDVVAPERLKALLEEPGGFDRALWTASAELGWPAAAAPESADGLGLGWHGLCVLAEELGRKAAALPLIPAAIAVRAILDRSASEEALRIVPRFVTGEAIACLALCEPGDAGIPGRPALQLAGGRLSGARAVTPFAAVADYALVHARDVDAVVLAIVPLDQGAVARCVVPTLDHGRAAAALEFSLADCLVLRGDAGVDRVREIAALAAVATAFEQIGAAQACLDMARAYAVERTAFGQPIGRFQAIKHKLADMYWRIEIARGCAIDAVDAFERADPQRLALAAAARIGAIEAAEFSARENIQAHGALGLTWEAMPQHYYRRSRALAVELGSTGYWRERLLADAGYDPVPQPPSEGQVRP
jgi:alkylation response protein AidB-like acyl-CoA dehydrogenase